MSEKQKHALMLILSAVCTGLSVAFSKYLGFIEWVSMIPMITVLFCIWERKDRRLRNIYALGLLYFECFYAVCFHWFFYLHPLDFTGITGPASVATVTVACFGLALFQALGGAFVFVAYALISRTRAAKKFPILKILTPAPLYAFYEFTQTFGSCGVPWARLALGQTDYLIPVEISSLLGSYSVTVIIVIVNTLLAAAVRDVCTADGRKIYTIAALGIYVANTILGTAIYFRADRLSREGSPVKVGIVQGNYSSAEKWTASPPDIVDRYIGYTELAAKEGAELIVWPETALPFVIAEGTASSNRIAIAARDLGVTVLVGTLTSEKDNDYNSVMCYMPDGSVNGAIYKKRHLVPFGEFVPMRGAVELLLPFLADISILKDTMTPGTDTEIFDTEICPIGALICFDSIYEKSVLETVRDGAAVITLSTNDSWFSDSAGIYMHNNQARLRAIETGRYVVRSANTGLSAVISTNGSVIKELPLSEASFMTCDIFASEATTLYTILGNTFVYICGFASALPLAAELYFILKERSKKQFCK